MTGETASAPARRAKLNCPEHLSRWAVQYKWSSASRISPCLSPTADRAGAAAWSTPSPVAAQVGKHCRLGAEQRSHCSGGALRLRVPSLPLPAVPTQDRIGSLRQTSPVLPLLRRQVVRRDILRSVRKSARSGPDCRFARTDSDRRVGRRDSRLARKAGLDSLFRGAMRARAGSEPFLGWGFRANPGNSKEKAALNLTEAPRMQHCSSSPPGPAHRLPYLTPSSESLRSFFRVAGLHRAPPLRAARMRPLTYPQPSSPPRTHLPNPTPFESRRPGRFGPGPPSPAGPLPACIRAPCDGPRSLPGQLLAGNPRPGATRARTSPGL